MTEVELNVLFNITPERVDNVYDVNSTKNKENILDIIKVFELAKEQRKELTKKISVRSLAPFRSILTSNN